MEAAELLRLLRTDVQPRSVSGSGSGSVSRSVSTNGHHREQGRDTAAGHVGKAEDFFKHLNENGQAIVRALASAFPERLTTNDLAERSKIGAMSLPPVIKHVRVVARKCGLNGDKVLARVVAMEDGKGTSKYAISEDVAKMVTEE